MKKYIGILMAVILLAISFAGCSAGAPAASGSASGAPNVWVVKSEAPVLDVQGNTVGTAYPGFTVNLKSVEDGKVMYAVAEIDEKGENMENFKAFFIKAKNMEKRYVEPQTVIMTISADMIRVNPGGTLYNGAGEKLITFNEGVGPVYYIQKSDQGYMFTLDSNVVFAPEDQVTIVRLS